MPPSLTWNQKKEIMSLVGDSAVILFEYYLYKTKDNNFSFNDEAVSKALGWTPRKVGDWRRALTKEGWFQQIRYSNKKHIPILVTLLGKEDFVKHERKIL